MKENIFERLEHSVQLLASPPDIQLQRLPRFVCKADELVLDFDPWQDVIFRNYGKELSVDQISSIRKLDEKLHWLTKNGVQHWTDDAVRTSPEWRNVQSLAASVLKAFGWSPESPPSYAHE
jgi:hypothetical protein